MKAGVTLGALGIVIANLRGRKPTPQVGSQAALTRKMPALRRLRRERPPVVKELRREAITLASPTPSELLGKTR